MTGPLRRGLPKGSRFHKINYREGAFVERTIRANAAVYDDEKRVVYKAEWDDERVAELVSKEFNVVVSGPMVARFRGKNIGRVVSGWGEKRKALPKIAQAPLLARLVRQGEQIELLEQRLASVEDWAVHAGYKIPDPRSRFNPLDDDDVVAAQEA